MFWNQFGVFFTWIRIRIHEILWIWIRIQSIRVHVTVCLLDITKEKDILERFQCKKFDIGGSKLPTETKKCQTGPYHYQQIEKAIFKIDKDGTDNDVSFKIASDANNVTCQKQLSRTFSDDWKRNNEEIWLRSDFGDCKNKLYKVNLCPFS